MVVFQEMLDNSQSIFINKIGIRIYFYFLNRQPLFFCKKEYYFLLNLTLRYTFFFFLITSVGWKIDYLKRIFRKN